MRKLIATIAALCFITAPALAQGGKQEFHALWPEDATLTEGIVVPTGSPVRLASFTRDQGTTASFSGRFELSGTYEIEGAGEDAFVTIWLDPKSKDRLPYWHDRGGPDQIYISNGREFAEAVASKDELAKLAAGRQPLIRGQVTIVADEYQIGIECDAANFSARFVSVVKNIEIAGSPPEEVGC